jgi:xanthine/CO dehydrogenase XdhC/CoxF family maturation factor
VKHWLESRQVFTALAEARRARRAAALATVIRVRGSAYRHAGAKLVVLDDGSYVGNVSGGCLEGDVRETALRVIATGTAERRSYCGGADEVFAWDLGVGCEGEVEVLIAPVTDDFEAEREAIAREEGFAVLTPITVNDASPTRGAQGSARRLMTGAAATEWLTDGSRLVTIEDREWFVDILTPPPRLVVVSGGDDAVHLARLADGVGLRVVVADRRPGLLAPERFPPSVRCVESDATQLAEHLVLTADDFAVVMTHHYGDDTAYLRTLLASPVRYIGMLGPRARTERILGVLRAEGPIDESRIYGPVGLDIGTDGAEQVAVAILAEILAVRSGRAPRSLRERRAPIHALHEEG